MTSRIIEEWLSSFPETVEDDNLSTHLSLTRNCKHVVSAIYELFDVDNFATQANLQIVQPLCRLFFNLYRSLHSELQHFTLQFVPSIILAYLWHVHDKGNKMLPAMETCLLGIYNLEVVDSDSHPKTTTFTIPTLATPSVYHEPCSIATLALTESMLMHYHSDAPVVITSGSLPQYQNVNAQNRMKILASVLHAYTADITHLPASSYTTLCLLGDRVSRRGFENLHMSSLFGRVDSLNNLMSAPSTPSLISRSSKSHSTAPSGDMLLTRIPLAPGFLLQLVQGLYYVIFNGHASEGIEAMDGIHLRASFELYSDVLLVTQAILNSVQTTSTGTLLGGATGLSVAPSVSSTRLSKQAITNASFRTRKLPDDIEVQTSALDLDASDKPPDYHDVVQPDKGPSAGVITPPVTPRLHNNPLKSIMKKTDKSRSPGSLHSPGKLRTSDAVDSSMVCVQVLTPQCITKWGDSDDRQHHVSVAVNGHHDSLASMNATLDTQL